MAGGEISGSQHHQVLYWWLTWFLHVYLDQIYLTEQKYHFEIRKIEVLAVSEVRSTEPLNSYPRHLEHRLQATTDDCPGE